MSTINLNTIFIQNIHADEDEKNIDRQRKVFRSKCGYAFMVNGNLYACDMSHSGIGMSSDIIIREGQYGGWVIIKNRVTGLDLTFGSLEACITQINKDFEKNSIRPLTAYDLIFNMTDEIKHNRGRKLT